MTALHDIWKLGPSHLAMADDEVHVWRLSLEQPDAVLRAFFETLTADERQKGQRFRSEKDRKHFIAGHGGLRAILSRYLNLAPQQLCFSYNRYGKPTLTDETGGESLRFNLSHAAGVALYALTSRREIGVDVEFIREDFAGMDIAERFFSPQEVEVLRALPAESRVSAFFNCWTRKEAYIKALGEGLSHPLDTFTVSLAPGEPAALLATEANPTGTQGWTLKELLLGDGYVAAAAVEGCECRFSYWLWNG